MKILVVSNMYPSKNFPSAGIFVKKFCDQTRNIGVEVILCVMKKSNSRIGKIVNYLKFYSSSFFKTLFINVDIVYVHYASHSSLSVLLANKIRKRTIYTNLHGSDVIPENRKQERFQKFTRQILQLSKKVIVPSNYFKELVSSKYNIPKDIIEVYPSGGIDSVQYYPIPSNDIIPFKCKFGINPQDKVFSYVGRITEGKGWDVYCHAIVKMHEKYSNVKFILVGSGKCEDDLNNLIDKLKIRDSIIRFPLLSPEDLLYIYNISDAFVFPTERKGESLGLVALEAMACGTPVIASDFAAPAGYIIDGDNGLKFKVGDSEELAKKIEQFLSMSADQNTLMKSKALKTAALYRREKCELILKNDVFHI